MRKGTGDRMIAEFIFTPTESKALIAKGIAALPRVKAALASGIIALHPSTSTYFLLRELTGEAPDTDKVWVTGMVVQKGMCVEMHTQLKKSDRENGLNKALADAGTYPHTYVVRNGKRVSGWVLNDLIDFMGAGDIYIKGINAFDSTGMAGVQIGSVDEFGTIGKMVAAAKQKGFEIITPAGTEKLIPGKMENAARFVNRDRDYAMGVKSKLYPFSSTLITETETLEYLTGVKAMVFSCGGVGGAEGAVCIAVEGDGDQIEAAVQLAESVKGVSLPAIYSPQCSDCSMPSCHLCGTQKPWIKED